jgi:hypothetical protein
MGYILLLDNQKRWAITPELLKKKFEKISNDFDISRIDNIERPYSYEFIIRDKNIEGFLHKDGDSIHIDGQFEECLKLALDIRSILPLDESVLFFDSSYNYSTVLEPSTTIDQLKNIFT